MISTDNRLTDRQIKNYLLGKCSAEQLAKIEQWISQSKENAQWLFRLEQMYHAGKENPYNDPAKIQTAELRLLARIRSEKEESDRNRMMTFWRYAASIVVIIAAGALVLYNYNKEEMLELATTDNVKEYLLPDSTHVWLNQHSTLRYPAHFGKKERKVELEGEALFEVKHDEQHPFSVKSGAMVTRVLGTVFNFTTRAKNNTEEVALLKGRVLVEGLSDEGKIMLHPNQKVVLDKAHHAMTVENTYAPLASVWHDSLIPFHNMRIGQIVEILQDFYHVHIRYSGLDNNDTYSGDIHKAGTISEVLSDLSYSIPFTYSVKGKEVVIVGK